MPASSISVLVVEDDQIHRDLVTEALKSDRWQVAGAREKPSPAEALTPDTCHLTPAFDVVFAGSCAEATRQLAARCFECVVLDHNLPDGSGDELLRSARSQLLTTPVVAFSTSVDPDVMLAEFKGGCVDFIPKRDAFKGDALARTIVNAVEKHRARAAVERSGSSPRLIEQAQKMLAAGKRESQQVQNQNGVSTFDVSTVDFRQKLQLIYETAVQTIQDGVLLIEGRERVVYANPAIKRLLGLDETADLPHHPRTTIDDMFTPDAAAAFRQHPADQAMFESVLRATTGDDVPVLIGQTPLGEHGVLCAVTDLREIKAQQRELESKNHRLAELYETANRFVDNVSHEFRTPLTVIKGYAEVIEQGLAGSVTEDQRGYLWTILDRTRDLSQMVDDLLDTSKIRSGCLRVDRRPQRITDLLEPHRPAIVQKALTHKVNFRDEIRDDLPLVYADGEKVGRIILNLVVNAMKFSPEGGDVVIWAKHEKRESQQVESQNGVSPFDFSPVDVVRIGVTDQGPGIASEHLAVIFERFKQVGTQQPQHSSTKGFGLGLNIARELVALNLGDMHVESTVGKGSSFSFTLPVHDPTAVAARLLERHAQNATAPHQVAVLRVKPSTRETLELLRSFLACNTRPMDLIFESTDKQSLILFGLCAEPDAWIARLADAYASQSVGCSSNNPRPLMIEVEGRWPVPSHNSDALHAVRESLGA